MPLPSEVQVTACPNPSALYEPAMLEVCRTATKDGARCPRKLFMQNASSVQLLELPVTEALDNANTPEDFDRLCRRLEQKKTIA